MAKDIYDIDFPKGLLSVEEFLVQADILYYAVSHADNIADDDRQIAFTCYLGNFCFQQGCYITASGTPRGSNRPMWRELYYTIQAAMNRYDIARDYFRDNFAIELHPLLMLTMIRNIFSTKSTNPFDVEMTKAYNEMIRVQEKNLEEIFAIHEKVNPDDVVPAQELKEEDIEKFFQKMEELKLFRSDRDKYDTDEEREIHDQIMSLYYSFIKKPKEDEPE